MEQTQNYARYKILFSILALAVLLWGAMGALDIGNITYIGYDTSPDNVVTLVRPGSPAEQAGLRVGDVVTKVDGIPIYDVAGFYSRERPAIGSSGTLTVRRDGAERTLNFKYGAQPTTDMIVNSGFGTLTGLAFLILGVMVYLRNPTRLSITLCALSLMFAALFLPRPYVASPTSRQIVNAFFSVMVGVLLAVMLDYCLHYPRAKKVITERPWLRQAIYIFAPALGLLFASINLLTPQIGARRGMVLSIGSALVYGGYILLAVVAVIHSYVKASAGERRETGLNLMMLGMVIGFGPLLVSILMHTLIPHMGELPTERFWPATVIAIPIGLALALMKLQPARAAAQAPESASA
ncbi:MAG TPA: PDZ domain-containing protein [Blastocatellia bacterium]|nr:PDZ domain-containing protein [Blastocatellia bacterium]